MRVAIAAAVLETVFGASAASSEDTMPTGDYCNKMCSQTAGCDQSYCKDNGLCFGLYHKGDSKCYQPGSDATDCDDSVLEPVQCAEYPVTTCEDVCNGIDGCKDSKWGTYCKSWQSPAVCFGIVVKDDGSLCFNPTDEECVGEPYLCEMATAVPTNLPETTVVPTNLPETTVVPTNLPETTVVPSNLPETTVVPSNLPETTVVPSNLPETTVVPSNLPETTAVPTNLPETTAVPTNLPETTVVPTNLPETTVVPSNLPETTVVPTNLPTNEDLAGDWCGETPLGPIKVTPEVSGAVNLFVAGETFTAEYYLDGFEIVFTNPDEDLATLLQQLDSSLYAIYTDEGVYVELVNVFSTTITRC